MAAEQVFSLASTLALAGWVVMLVAPRRALMVVPRLVIPALLAAAYAAIVATQWGASQGGFSSLAEVARLFENPWMLLAGWIHYLAFDMLIGAWEVRDAQERGVPHLAVVPCLALTLMFGPAGWLAYLGVRAAFQGSSSRVGQASDVA
jgi:hypothetical protein